MNCQKFNNTPIFFTSERESSELNKETFRHYKRMISFQKLPKSCQIFTFTHLLFWCSITVIECIYFDETFFWEFCFSVLSFFGNSFVRGGTKPHEQSKSFVKRMCYIVHETSTCWDNIRSSMSNEVNIRKLFPMSYRATEYNLMQWKWKLLLLGRKSKH